MKVVRQLIDAFDDYSSDEAMGYARDLLHLLAEQPDQVAANAHPLGFVHIPLTQGEDGSRFRLHLWPRPPFHPQAPALPIHQHAWPLLSLVVSGRIRDEQYTVEDDPAGERQLFETTYQADRSVLKPAARTVRCVLAESVVREQGVIYEVPVGVFHCSTAELPSATVVKAGIPSTQAAFVLGPARRCEAYTYERRKLSPSELQTVLSGIAATA